MSAAIHTDHSRGCRLWIDGVGTWLVWFSREFALGNAAPSSEFRWSIQADLRTIHARIEKVEEGHWIEPCGQTSLDGRTLSGPALLIPDCRIRLGSDVEIQYRLPSPLSSSAVLQVTSGHRPADATMGVVLMEQTCLLGPGRQRHVPCPGWGSTILLYLQHGELRWRVQGTSATSDPMRDGDILSGEDWCFRAESVN